MFIDEQVEMHYNLIFLARFRNEGEIFADTNVIVLEVVSHSLYCCSGWDNQSASLV